MRPRQVFHNLEMLKNSSSTTLRRQGALLSEGDSSTVLEVYQQWVALLIDLGYLHPDCIFTTGRRLWLDITKVDVLELNNAMAGCAALIKVQQLKGFKALCSAISPHLYPIIKDDVKRIAESDVVAAKRLLQVFCYTGRLSLRDIDLTQQMLQTYLEVDSKIDNQYPEHICRVLNKIVKRWFGAFGPDEIIPHHGPGGIAEEGRCPLQVKYRLLRHDVLLRYCFGEPWWVMEPFKKEPLHRVSRTIFVPKSYKTFRTISMEPATLQYFQQGVRRSIEEIVYRDRYLRNHIGFDDQTRNQELARIGSINRSYSTIDLSSASDSVGYEFVKRVFRGTWLLRYIVATRSKETILPDGTRLTTKKFAPMGSSLCFPVMTIIFAALCDHVTRVNRVSGDYSVYGDDIVVPTSCADSVIRLLTVLGFAVNTDKTFMSQDVWYRESCGKEYCDGYDVTPIRVSRKYSSLLDDVDFPSLIAKANEAYRYGYRNLRYCYLGKLFNLIPVPFFSPSSLESDSYTNYHTKERWNANLQRREYLVNQVITSKDRHYHQNEAIRYHHWLQECYRRNGEITNAFVADVGKTRLLLGTRYRAYYDD